ncbi:MAG: hypothetical protein ACOCRK_01155 [bacterium]
MEYKPIKNKKLRETINTAERFIKVYKELLQLIASLSKNLEPIINMFMIKKFNPMCEKFKIIRKKKTYEKSELAGYMATYIHVCDSIGLIGNVFDGITTREIEKMLGENKDLNYYYPPEIGITLRDFWHKKISLMNKKSYALKMNECYNYASKCTLEYTKPDLDLNRFKLFQKDFKVIDNRKTIKEIVVSSSDTLKSYIAGDDEKIGSTFDGISKLVSDELTHMSGGSKYIDMANMDLKKVSPMIKKVAGYLKSQKLSKKDLIKMSKNLDESKKKDPKIAAAMNMVKGFRQGL